MQSAPAHEGGRGGSSAKGVVQAPRVLLEKGPSPLNLRALNTLLRVYPKRQEAAYLEAGFELGFRIPAEWPRKAFFAGNLKSVRGLEHVTQEKIAKEVREGWVQVHLLTLLCPILEFRFWELCPKRHQVNLG